jgi:UPF0271 protein
MILPAPVPFGDAAWRASLPAELDRRALLESIRRIPGVVDVVLGERDVLATFDPSAPVGAEAISDAMARARGIASAVVPRPSHDIPVRYDGEDLDAVARAASISPSEVVEAHAAAKYVVAFVGFVPGFAYLAGLDPRLRLPRRESPRPRVPARSVAIAGPYAGVYPFSTPGGWHLLGTAIDFDPFDPSSGALLSPGDSVRFVPAR